MFCNNEILIKYFLGYLYCPQMAGRNNRTYAVDIWVQPQHTERYMDLVILVLTKEIFNY